MDHKKFRSLREAKKYLGELGVDVPKAGRCWKRITVVNPGMCSCVFFSVCMYDRVRVEQPAGVAVPIDDARKASPSLSMLRLREIPNDSECIGFDMC